MYIAIYGSKSLGTVSFDNDGKGLAESSAEEKCRWTHSVNGVSFPWFGTFSLKHEQRKGYFKWDLSSHIGYSLKNEKVIKDYLAEHPMNLTKNEAYAIAVKASKKLGIDHKEENIWFYYSAMKQSLSPTMPANLYGEKRPMSQWKAKGEKHLPLTSPRFCTKVTIASGLHLNEFFMDWATKEIIHVNSYRQSW